MIWEGAAHVATNAQGAERAALGSAARQGWSRQAAGEDREVQRDSTAAASSAPLHHTAVLPLEPLTIRWLLLCHLAGTSHASHIRFYYDCDFYW